MKRINVVYIPSVWEPVWIFPTIYNKAFDKVQTLWWIHDDN